MSLRVLIIEDELILRRLLAHHVASGFDRPRIAEYDPVARGPLPAAFAGDGYDVVLLGDSPGGDGGLAWLRDLAGREDFPPIIYLLSGMTAAARELALAAGARGCIPARNIDHGELIALLRASQARRGQPEPEAAGAEPAAGESRFGELTLRGYRCLRKLAETPVSAVYVARNERTGEKVALKVLSLPPEGSEGARSVDRFLHEYQIASAIVHPNIVRVHDFGASDDHAFIVMEYFPRGDLRTQIKAGIEPLQALGYLRQMAEALQVLHQAGVLHRDLKPGNVMLRNDSSVALIDYGLSKQMRLDADFTGSGEILGTPFYMSPEQGHGRETDARSDIYSLGVIFYEMLMRRKPYVAATPMQVIYKHAQAPLPELPAELRRFEKIMIDCMAKDPDRRYASADRLLDAVRETERDQAQASNRSSR